jgi:hypothetical protein
VASTGRRKKGWGHEEAPVCSVCILEATIRQPRSTAGIIVFRYSSNGRRSNYFY